MTRENDQGFEQSNLSARVVYQDGDLLVVDKPSGLLVHRGWGRDAITLVDLVRQLLGEKSVYPIHRIDRGTSGVVAFARTPEVAAKLGELQCLGKVRKTYLALVRGASPASGVINHPIPRIPGGARVPARTVFKTLFTAPALPRSLSLVEASLDQGRLHQVRRHLKHIDHPVIGDANYGKGDLNRAIAERYGLKRLALHAAQIEFPHPTTGKTLICSAPLPDDLKIPFCHIGIPADAWTMCEYGGLRS